MTAEKYLQQLAAQLNIEYVKKRKPFIADPMLSVKYKGTIMGARAGYLLSLSLVNIGNNSMLAIQVRYPEIADTKPLEDQLKSSLGISKLKLSKRVQVKPGYAEIHWSYAFTKPKIENVMPLVDSLIASVSMYAPAFDGKCQVCHNVSTPEITLFNDVPGYHCPACQAKTAGDRQMQAEKYSRRPMDLPWALLWATFTAVGCALAMALIYYLLDDKGRLPLKVWFLMPCVAGAAIAYVFGKKVGRVEVAVQAAPLVILTIAAAWAADTGYVTAYVVRTEHMHLSQDLVLRLNRF